MRIAKRLEETEAAAAANSAAALPEGMLQRRNGQLPPINGRKGSDPGPLTREKEGLLTPAIEPTPPDGAKSKRSPKEAASPKAADGAASAARPSDPDKKKDPLEGRKKAVLSYVVFLCVFALASANGRTPDMYYQNSVVETYMSLGQVRPRPFLLARCAPGCD